MRTVSIVVTEDPAVIDSGQMRSNQGEIVLNDCAHFVYPHLFAKDRDSTPTAETGRVVSDLFELRPLCHTPLA